MVKSIDQMTTMSPPATSIAMDRVVIFLLDTPILRSIIRPQPEISTCLMGSGRAQVYHNDGDTQKEDQKPRDK